VLGQRLVFNTRAVAHRLSAALDSNARSTPIVAGQNRSFTRGYANASLAADLGHHQIKFGGDIVYASVREELSYLITEASRFDPDTPATFRFDDAGRDREQSLFAQDTVRLGPFTASAGLRFDRYAFMVSDHAFSPRLGVAWSAPGGHLVLRGAYDRVFQTPAIENLLLASSPAIDALGSALRIPIEPSRGNFLEGGLTAGLGDQARLDVTAYRRTFTQFADDDVFLNTGVSFPIAFDAARIGGVDAKLTVVPWRRLNGFASYSLLKGTARLPVVGGLFLGREAIEELEDTGEVTITQDQRHTVRAQMRIALHDRLWVATTVRYGSGLPVEIEDDLDDELLAGQYGDEILERVDLERGRVRANVAVDAGAGARLWQTGRRRLSLRIELANVTNRLNVINFAGLFSGTAVAAPRSATARLQIEF
jgi:outer membrane receptor for Fe3+-dicitrate